MPRKIVWSPIQISDCSIFAVCVCSLLYNTLLPSPHMLNSSKQQHLLSHSFHGLESGCDLAGFSGTGHWWGCIEGGGCSLIWWLCCGRVCSHIHMCSGWEASVPHGLLDWRPQFLPRGLSQCSSLHQDEQTRRARAEERGLVESLFSYSQGEEIIQRRDGGMRRQRSLGAAYHTAWLQEGECLYFSFSHCKMG